MPRGRFITLLSIVTTTATAALMLGMRAVRDGGAGPTALALVSGAAAAAGMLVLVRVVVVVERSRRHR